MQVLACLHSLYKLKLKEMKDQTLQALTIGDTFGDLCAMYKNQYGVRAMYRSRYGITAEVLDEIEDEIKLSLCEIKNGTDTVRTRTNLRWLAEDVARCLRFAAKQLDVLAECHSESIPDDLDIKLIIKTLQGIGNCKKR